jgi:dihydrolipoamide dehydrogenase
MTPKGVTVDKSMRTSAAGVWAAGDVTGLMQLAHAASRQGEIAASSITASLEGNPALCQGNVWSGLVPWVVYGLTEAAGVGITEQEAARENREVIKKTLPASYSGRFVAENGFRASGAVKLIADAHTRRILGVHAVGSYASEFIGGASLLIEKEMSIEDTRRLIFPHPTVSELIRDCVWEM